MSRRSQYWRKRPSSSLPFMRVLGTGRRAFGKHPNSGLGNVVSEPASERKRRLVAQWKGEADDER